MNVHYYASSEDDPSGCNVFGCSTVGSSRVIPVPWQSGQSSQVNINLLAPPKKDVCPDPPQPIHGAGFLGGLGGMLVIFVISAVMVVILESSSF